MRRQSHRKDSAGVEENAKDTEGVWYNVRPDERAYNHSPYYALQATDIRIDNDGKVRFWADEGDDKLQRLDRPERDFADAVKQIYDELAQNYEPRNPY